MILAMPHPVQQNGSPSLYYTVSWSTLQRRLEPQLVHPALEISRLTPSAYITGPALQLYLRENGASTLRC